MQGWRDKDSWFCGTCMLGYDFILCISGSVTNNLRAFASDMFSLMKFNCS